MQDVRGISSNLIDRLGGATIAVALILNALTPVLENQGLLYHLFIVVAASALIPFARLRAGEWILILGFSVWALAIASLNGWRSLRLGLLSSLMFGFLYSRWQVARPVIALVVTMTIIMLYRATEGFSKLLFIAEGVSDAASINYFGQILFMALLADMLSNRRRESSALALFVAFGAIVAAVFVPSRQLALVVALAILYSVLIGTGKRWKLPLVAILFGWAIFQARDAGLNAVERLADQGVESSRMIILNCYFQRLDVTDLLIGSDTTAAGQCGIDTVGVEYLHNGYLELVSQSGLAGLLLTFVLLGCAIGYSYKRDYLRLLFLIYVGIYQFIEGGFMWVYILCAFWALQEKGWIRLLAGHETRQKQVAAGLGSRDL